MESKATAKTLGSGETSALSSNDSSALQVPGLYTQGRTASTKEKRRTSQSPKDQSNGPGWGLTRDYIYKSYMGYRPGGVTGRVAGAK